MMTVHPWNEDILKQLVAQRERSAHAWLFIGPAGIGKTDCAMAFARQLTGAADEPRMGALFDAGTHPDVHVIVRETDTEDSDLLHHRYARRHVEERTKGTKPKTVITIGQVRRLIEALSTHAHSGRCKVALVLDAHQMNINAANALLKLLEEPPEDTVLVCVTDQMHRLPATVRSRCAIVPFSLPARDPARQWLAARVPEESVDAALDLAGGAPLEALRLVNEERLEGRKQWLKGLEALYSGRADPPAVAEIGIQKVGLSEALSLSQKVLADLVRCRLGAPPERLFNPDMRQWLQKRSQRLQLDDTFDLIDALGRMRQDVDGPLDAALQLEDTLVRMRQAVAGSA